MRGIERIGEDGGMGGINVREERGMRIEKGHCYYYWNWKIGIVMEREVMS